jgi:MFS family permease
VFVLLLALARPQLSAANGVAGVVAAEETSSADRSKAVALIGAAYAVGSGIPAVARGLVDGLGFRQVFAFAAVALLALPFAARWVREPERYRVAREGRRRASADRVADASPPRLGSVPAPLRARLAVVCTVHVGVGLVTGPVNTYLFVYGENVVGVTPATMSLLFVGAGGLGLAGLLVGRWAADRIGRRVTAGCSLAVASLAGVLTYSGQTAGLAAGYLVTVTAASVFAPAAGSLDAEIFPTSVRATAAGWLTAAQVLGGVVGLFAFGVLADAFGAFAPAAAAVTLPVVGLSLLYVRLPETRGMELEESAPEASAAPPP